METTLSKVLHMLPAICAAAKSSTGVLELRSQAEDSEHSEDNEGLLVR